jgi:CheY-like chemotaxis protein
VSDELRVLCIDESIVHLLAVKARLQSLGFVVTIASDLRMAEGHIEGMDLVIVDFHMPGTQGADLVARLKKQPGGDKPLFYLYTSDRNIAADYSHHGFDGAFTQKGSLDELARQAGNVAKLIRMKRTVQSSPRIRGAR